MAAVRLSRRPISEPTLSRGGTPRYHGNVGARSRRFLFPRRGPVQGLGRRLCRRSERRFSAAWLSDRPLPTAGLAVMTFLLTQGRANHMVRPSLGPGW
ncbi:hypothetical protein EV659_11051 [Rhodothalassium salexigens DSM 2132]|uniref:Uncharacterized protein n=1 Tax=Rhodothalassium salexigens DSM 2132 TaxID=1188247 RepID=A0A4R2PD14_RHOSA|nr:hypothetical protein [Rhodothalassium salexigens DSM 2132]TCP31971.1 hypothetical protein EV659_11051 [Rhodothalassium salexigens DSM 2132]